VVGGGNYGTDMGNYLGILLYSYIWVDGHKDGHEQLSMLVRYTYRSDTPMSFLVRYTYEFTGQIHLHLTA